MKNKHHLSNYMPIESIIINITEEEQINAIIQAPELIEHFDITNNIIKQVLTNETFLNYPSHIYNRGVELLCKNNQLLVNKWIRYGEAMRSQ